MTDKGYKKLRVYGEAHALVKLIYQATDVFPKSETFGLMSQMRRSAVSVPANIIEGQARSSKKEFRHFLSIANGSLTELEYYIELSFDLNYIDRKNYEFLNKQQHAVGMLLGGLIKSLKNLTPWAQQVSATLR